VIDMTKLRRRQFLQAAASAAALPAFAGVLNAQAFPERPIRIVVPFAAGGGVDVLARHYAETLKGLRGVTVVIENRAGGNGTVGAGMVRQSAADGYTLLLSASTHIMARQIMRNVPFDPVTDFVPIARLGEAPLLVVMAPNLPHKSIAELVAAAKLAPERYTMAVPSLGSMGHLATIAFNRLAAVNLTITSYRGTAPALTDVVGGHVQIMIDAMLALLPQARSGKVKALAITTPKRSALAPEIPTAAESGMKGLEFASWYGVWAPRDLPGALAAWLNTAFNESTRELARTGRFAQLGQEPVVETRDEFARFIEADLARNAELLKLANFQPV
jgi:tripartite-type tricarboxylate transporter receptor subunit TctC